MDPKPTTNRAATVTDACPRCGTVRFVQPCRRGRVCKRCRNREKAVSRRRPHSVLYPTWHAMMRRCGHRPGGLKRDFKYYRDLGVKVCIEWHDCAAFYAWAVGNGWRPGLSIDRIDPTQGYTPNNCQWLPLRENISRGRRPYSVYRKDGTYALGA